MVQRARRSMIFIPANGTWEEQAGAVVRGFVTDLKVKDFQAAGIVGNFGYESGEFTKLHEIGQPEGQGGYGWAQWTGSRRRNFLSWCATQNLDWRSDEANYGFAVHEIQTSYKSMLVKLRKTATLRDATFLIYAQYETPQEYLDGSYGSLPARVRYAERALAGAGSVPDPGPGPGPSPAPELTNLDHALFIQASATRIIQHELGLRIDGDYGPGTRRAVLDYLKKGAA